MVINLQNVVDSWASRLLSALHGTMAIQEKDWSAFYQSLDEWVVCLEQTQMYVGTTQTEEDRQDGKPHIR